MKKKILSLVLALLMAASSASAILADDVAIDDEAAGVEATAAIDDEVVAGQYDNAIKFLNQYGIFKGKSADNLGAEDMLERYQMALFVARIATGWVDDEQWEDGPENWSEFTDISEGPAANYWGALSYANSQGIIEGYGNGKFGPTDGITYQNALTMVVRTLGYQGLEWPWGYIQKAVELGLTDGITGITYQDELNRGEVAQIIYNALFATTKSGSTLAMKSFGIEFGWEKVVITASDLEIFTKDNKDAKPEAIAKKTNGYKGFKNSDRTDPGYLAFKILNDDGSLSEDTYYMLASDIGLSTVAEAHDDEAVVGDAYYMLFEKDDDSNLVKTVAYESLLVDTLKNEGKTDDDGEAQKYPIKEFLKDYELVSKYTGKNYVNVTASGKKELLVYTAFSTLYEWEVDGNWLAIDWATGDILVPVLKSTANDDGKILDSEIEKDEDGNYVYKVAWYYNKLLDKYYEIGTNIDVKGGEDTDDYVYGINYMSDAEFEKTYKDALKYVQQPYNGYKLLEKKSDTNSAYAELKLYDTNLDGVADRGLYEDYSLGYFTESSKWCDHKTFKTYKITSVGAWDARDASYKSVGSSIEAPARVEDYIEGEDCGGNRHENRVWFVDGYTPVPAYDEDGEFTGYKAGYVIYNYDAETGAIKVVKNIDANNDIDTYTTKGVLRAYNLKNGTITVGDTNYKIFDYNELKGNAFAWVNSNAKARAAYASLLRDLFNQYVEIVVVDGDLVNIKAVARTEKEVIVVDSYAGLSADGYIVVNGYSTDTLKYEQFRIGSYDGWMKGDYYYYLNEKKAKESFTKGAVYAIRSYDEDEDVYYVNLAGKFSNKGTTYTVEEGVNKYDVTIKADSDGYMQYTYKGKTYDVKMKSDDKYIIVPEITEKRPYASIIVYEGVLPKDAEISGLRINSDDRNNKTYVFVNATVKNLADTYKSGLVVLLDDNYWIADYNGSAVDANDKYLLGASVFEVCVVDLYTGKLDAIYTGTNIDLNKGHVYYTQDGVLVEDLGMLTADVCLNGIVKEVGNAYPDKDTYISDRIDDIIAIKAVYESDKDDAHKVAIEDKLLVGKVKDDAYNKLRKDKVDSVLYRTIEFTKKGEVKSIENIDRNKIAGYIKDNKITALPAFYIYDVEGKDIVIYLVVTDATTVVKSEEKLGDKFDVVLLNDAKIVGQVIYEEVTTTVAGTPSITHNILGVRYEFEGKAVEGIHANILKNGYHFGAKGDHIAEKSYTVQYGIRTDETTVPEDILVYASIVADEYYDCNDKNADCEGCDLVKAIEVRFDKKDVPTVKFYDDPATTTKYDSVTHYTIWTSITRDIDDTVVFGACVENRVVGDKYINGRVYDAAILDMTTDPVGTSIHVNFVPGGMGSIISNNTGVGEDTIVDSIINGNDADILG